MSRPDPHHDAMIDARLRDVPLPAGLADRLRQSVLDDADLDAILRDVPAPAGLADRLRAAISTASAMPTEPARLPRPSDRRRRPARRAAPWAAALSLLVAIGLSYLGLLAVWILPDQSSPRTPVSVLAGAAPERLLDSEAPALLALDQEAAEERSSNDGIAGSLSPPVPAVRFTEPRISYESWLDAMDAKFGPGSPDPFADALAHRWGDVFTSHRSFDELPELKRAAGLSTRGITWPLVAGANSAFLIRYGVHPFVSPQSHPQLAAGIVPLDVDAASYELLKRWLEDGELPPPKLIRTEEFLAALNYGFPQPVGQPLGLTIAGGPSPLGAPKMQLMQVGVQAAGLHAADRPPARFVFLLDVSASMNWGGRFDMVRRALQTLIRQIGPEDKLSLVAFSEGAELVVENIGADEADRFSNALRGLRVRSSTNIGAGLCYAFALAEQIAVEYGVPVHVVMLTDGLTELDRSTVQRIETRLANAARQQLYLDVIDLGQEAAGNPQLEGFARAGGGALRRAVNADQVRWNILETLTGRSQLVAAGVSLKVSFNPKVVAGYRLFGHEAHAVAGALPNRTENDFHADQAATALYELLLKPEGGNEVATVELSWRPVQGGPRQSMTRSVLRSDFAAAYSSAPLSLQEATIAAAAAEVLRESPFTRVAPYASSLARVLELVGKSDSRLLQRADFADFTATIERALRAKPSRGGVKR